MKPRDAFTLSYDFKTKRAAEKMRLFLEDKGGRLLADDAGFDVGVSMESEKRDFKDEKGVEGLFWDMIQYVTGLHKDDYKAEYEGLPYAAEYIPSAEDFASYSSSSEKEGQVTNKK